jgi:hypothetical protein
MRYLTRPGSVVVRFGDQFQSGTHPPFDTRARASTLEIEIARIVQYCDRGKNEVLGFELSRTGFCGLGSPTRPSLW